EQTICKPVSSPWFLQTLQNDSCLLLVRTHLACKASLARVLFLLRLRSQIPLHASSVRTQGIFCKPVSANASKRCSEAGHLHRAQLLKLRTLSIVCTISSVSSI